MYFYLGFSVMIELVLPASLFSNGFSSVNLNLIKKFTTFTNVM